MSRCLLLIDLQNEFLASGGNFPVHESCLPFLANIRTAVGDFRSTRDPIYWIRSEYSPELADLTGSLAIDSFLSGTHKGRKPCCAKDTFGAQFPEEIVALIKRSTGIVVTKTWYSAFKETTLLSDLNNRGITDVFIGGLLTNVCVRATATEAFNLKFHVHVLEDCVGWRNHGSHVRALGNMHDLGIQVTSTTRLKEVHPLATIPRHGNDPAAMEVPTLYYVNGSIPSWRVFMALYEKVHSSCCRHGSWIHS
jgi:nicotinamidase-related amidase